MEVGKVINAVQSAIDRRPLVDGHSFLLIWEDNKFHLIPKSSEKEAHEVLGELTEYDCSKGLSGSKWDSVLRAVIETIYKRGRKADYE